MKTYIALMLTLIFFALTGIGYIYYQDLEFKKIELKNKDVKIVETKEIKTTTETPKLTNPIPLPGTVKGKLCYPSSGIPEMTIFAKNIANEKVTELNTKQDEMKYEFKDLDTGTYVFYAYRKDDQNKSLGGGYTKMVPCGLTVECTDHDLIEVNVESGKIVENIDICDWYGANLPK